MFEAVHMVANVVDDLALAAGLDHAVKSGAGVAAVTQPHLHGRGSQGLRHNWLAVVPDDYRHIGDDSVGGGLSVRSSCEVHLDG